MNKKLVSFVCCPAVVGSYSGSVSGAIEGKVHDFIMYKNNGGFFKPEDLYELDKLICKINCKKKMSDELLAFGKKYGSFDAFGYRFKFSDLTKLSAEHLSNLLEIASTFYHCEVSKREGAIKALKAKLMNKTQEKERVVEELRKSLNVDKFFLVLDELSKGPISQGPLHVCILHFYILVPRVNKLEQDVKNTKNFMKKKKALEELEEIAPVTLSKSVFYTSLLSPTTFSGLDNLYKQFINLSTDQKNQIRNLVELDKSIDDIKSTLDGCECKPKSGTNKNNSYIFSNKGPCFDKQPEGEKNTVIEIAKMVYEGIRLAHKVHELSKKIEKRTEEFEKKYPTVFFPWQKIPNNDLVRRLKDVENKYEDLDKVYEVQDPKSDAPLEKLRYQETEYSNRIANIRACIPNEDFEEDKDLNDYVKELIMLYQARQAVRNEIEVYELFRVLGENSSEITYQD